MNKLFMLIVATALLNACASQPTRQTSLVASLAVGVQEHVAPLSHMADTLFTPQGLKYTQPSALEYASGRALQEGLSIGNYDVVLGLLETLPKQHDSDTKYITLQKVHLHYLIKAERRDLHLTENKKHFFSNVKAVGYVSVGEAGITNELLIGSFSNAYNYQACGTLPACIDMLHASNIDAIATTDLAAIASLNEELATHSKRIITAKFSALGTYGLVLNSLTLSRDEIQQLASTLWQRAVSDTPKNAQHDSVRIVDTVTAKQR